MNPLGPPQTVCWKICPASSTIPTPTPGL
jgi:hypothetical protein